MLKVRLRLGEHDDTDFGIAHGTRLRSLLTFASQTLSGSHSLVTSR